MAKHLVLAGAGHAHLETLLRLEDFTAGGHRVTVVNPLVHHYYSGMGPGLLGGTYRLQDIRFHIRKMVETRGGQFIEDRVTGIEPRRRILSLQSAGELRYDLVSFNTGSTIRCQGLDPCPPQHYAVKPIENLYRARRAILERLPEKLSLLVIGGGAAGIEIAGNLHRLLKTRGAEGTLTLAAGGRLLPTAPAGVRDKVRRSLRKRNIVILENERVSSLADGRATLADGETLRYDLAFLATGVESRDSFARDRLPVAPQGGLLVNRFLHSTADPRIFGGGDCVTLEDLELARVGVHAVRQGAILHHNLLASTKGQELRPFEPQKKYLLILNLGDGRGVGWRGSLRFDGKVAFRLKDWIDRKFMRKYQVSTEAQEEEKL